MASDPKQVHKTQPIPDGYGNDLPVVNAGGGLGGLGVGLTQVKTRTVTAIRVQIPRDYDAIEKRCKVEAKKLGSRGLYGWGEGEDRIEGPTVKLAMIAARNYMNCEVDLEPVQEFRDAWIFSARFVDHETGFCLTRQFRQSKYWKVYGRHDEERKMDIRFQIGQSKAVRNVVMQCVPGWLVDGMMDECKSGARERIEKLIEKETLPEVQRKSVAWCVRLGVPEARVLATYGRATVAELTVENLVMIHANCTAIQDGEDTAENAFPGGKKADAAAASAENARPVDVPTSTGRAAQTTNRNSGPDVQAGEKSPDELAFEAAVKAKGGNPDNPFDD